MSSEVERVKTSYVLNTFPGKLIIDLACESFIAFEKYPNTSSGSKCFPGLICGLEAGVRESVRRN